MLDVFIQGLNPRIDQCKGDSPWLDSGRKPRPPDASLKPRFD